MGQIVGDDNPNILDGTAGNDTISGLGGSDTLNGSSGTDHILGGLGADVISGGDGADLLEGGDGDDVIYGHSSAGVTSASGDIVATQVTTGLFGAVFLTSAPDDPGTLYVVQKDNGRIVAVDPATGDQTTVLDIPDAQISNEGEQGLLGLAFHPDYATNGRIYVFLNNAAGDIEIREYTRSLSDPAIIDPATMRPVITISHPVNSNHNGGFIGFGPDDFLYVAVGDGGASNDPNNNAQNINSLLGKILRIDVDGDAFPADPTRNYSIPAGNPFVGQAGADEIWALGLRNPWRPSFDSATGDFYIADVGQANREEIDFQPAGVAGVNYGWRIMEGTRPNIAGTPASPLTGPVFEYDHSLGVAVTGGYVYHGPAAGLQGAYFFADFGSNRLWTLRVVDGVAVDAVQRTTQIQSASGPVTNISSFGVDGVGNLYAVSLGGSIFRIDPSAAAGDGADELVGGNGNDTLIGGPLADLMRGGPGDDLYVVDSLDFVVEAASEGTDEIETGLSNYTLPANVENLTFTGAGDFTGFGNALANALVGGPGNDVLVGAGGADSLSGADGNDTLLGESLDTLSGGSGFDVLQVVDAGSMNLDIVAAGIEYVVSGFGDDFYTAASGSAAVQVYGSGGNDTITGGAGDDRLWGGIHNDTLTGNDGHDVLVGDLGTDSLSGGGGNDSLYIGSEDTFIDGGAGFDAAYVVSGSGITLNIAATSLEWISDFANGNDTIDASAASASVAIFAGGGIDNLTGGSGNDLIFAGTGNDGLAGGEGNDSLVGEAGADSLSGGGGNDQLHIDSSDTLIDGGTGFDVAYISAGTGLTLNMAMANLEFIQDLAGGADNIDASGTSASVSIFSGAGIDALIGGSAGDTLWAGTGNDILTGNGGGDTLVGEGGQDRLIGGLGNDQLHGGADSDTFVWTSGGDTDIVFDWSDGSDRLEFNAVAGLDDASDLTIVNNGANADVFFGAARLFVVTGAAGQIGAGDFLFT